MKSGIRDNRRRGTAASFLQEKVNFQSELSVVSAYFTSFAYSRLSKTLNKIGRLRFLFGAPLTKPNTKTLAQTSKLDRSEFPDPPYSEAKATPATYENFAHLMAGNSIEARFNTVKKRVDVDIPGLETGRQNRDTVTLNHLTSLAIRNRMSPAHVPAYLLSLADANSYDPFANWVTSRPWDQTSRIAEICETVVPEEDYPVALRDVLIRKWLLSIVAATFKQHGFRARGVLTLQGGQGIGKTSWIANLVTSHELRDECIKLGHCLDGGKDSRLAAIRHRIVELGELEGSLRREMAGLKAFITETYDKIRPPYARVESEYPRSTIFGASVNDRHFLMDTTGNSRFWTIAVEQIDYNHSVDMQQVFAELKTQFDDGAKWWLTSSEESILNGVNNQHRLMSSVETRISEELDLDRVGQTGLPRLSANEVLGRLGFEKPTNAQSKEANVALRAMLGESKRVRGRNLWSIPWSENKAGSSSYEAENTY